MTSDQEEPRIPARLSADQEVILVWALDALEWGERNLSEFGRGLDSNWGVRWDPHKGRDASPSRRACMSRSLKRLEERGLILRRNDITGDPYSGDTEKHTRTTRVKLTEAGRQAAEQLRLTKRHRQTVSRLETVSQSEGAA